jgi:histidinol-phosphate aminotransferase
VEKGRPVVLLRTFSKIFGLAGLRLGYTLAHESLVPFLDVVQEPFNVNRAALAAGCASLRHADLVDERRLENEQAREALAASLRELGLEPFASQANFLLVDVGIDDLDLAKALLRRSFLVRPGEDFGMPGYIRVTIGPLPLMERLAAALGDALEELSAAEAAG